MYKMLVQGESMKEGPVSFWAALDMFDNTHYQEFVHIPHILLEANGVTRIFYLYFDLKFFINFFLPK